MPRRGNKRKKKQNHKEIAVSTREIDTTPRCFVIKKGKIGERVEDLVQDLREVMAPNCAKRLKESKMNRIEDFMAVAQHFHVSHVLQFSATKSFNYMRVIKLPVGPTLTFKVNSFSTARDVKASQRKQPVIDHHSFEFAPIQIINGFSAQSEHGSENARQLSAEMLRGLLPPIDVPNFNQANVRRAALFNYDKEEDTILFRHYAVTKKGMGLQRGVAKLMRTHRTLKLGAREDIADFVLSGGQGATETEIEDKPEEAPSAEGGKIGVHLSEIGPRLTLQLIKAEEGINAGVVMYHRYRDKPLTGRELQEQKAHTRQKQKAHYAKIEGMAAKNNLMIKKIRDAQTKRETERKEDREEWGLDPIKEKGSGEHARGSSKKKKKEALGRKGKGKGGGEGQGGGKGGGGADKGGEKGKGEGKGKGKGKGKRKRGGDAEGNKNPRQKTLDRFQSMKKPRTS